MQQNIVVSTVASFIIMLLSIYWVYHEIQFVSIMNEFDQDITWFIQAPIMIFAAFLALVFFGGFITNVTLLNLEELKAEIPWKKLLLMIVSFHVFMGILMAIFIFLEIKNEFLAQVIMLITVVGIYIYGVIKYKINPIFLLLSLSIVFSFVLYIVLSVF